MDKVDWYRVEMLRIQLEISAKICSERQKTPSCKYDYTWRSIPYASYITAITNELLRRGTGMRLLVVWNLESIVVNKKTHIYIYLTEIGIYFLSLSISYTPSKIPTMYLYRRDRSLEYLCMLCMLVLFNTSNPKYGHHHPLKLTPCKYADKFLQICR